MRTIIQHIGPLYGELNTGSVFGQPNGSVAIGQNLVPTPSEPTIEEVEIWDLSYYDDMFGKYMLFTSSVASGTLTFSSRLKRNSGATLEGPTLCNVSLLSAITESNTTTKFEVATDEQFSDIIFSGIVPTPEGDILPSFTGLEKPDFSSGTTYYMRLCLYSSAGTYLYNKSDVLPMTYYAGD